MPLIAIMGASVPAFLVFILLYMDTYRVKYPNPNPNPIFGWFISPVGLTTYAALIMGASVPAFLVFILLYMETY